jgi:hypothetical protein
MRREHEAQMDATMWGFVLGWVAALIVALLAL